MSTLCSLASRSFREGVLLRDMTRRISTRTSLLVSINPTSRPASTDACRLTQVHVALGEESVHFALGEDSVPARFGVSPARCPA